MLTMTPAAFAALLLNLGTASPVVLLEIAESAAMAVLQGSASAASASAQEMFVAACGAVSASCGYPLGSYSAQDQSTICAAVANFMQGLRGLAAGPATLQNPLSNTYQFRL
jgi:hypothetical protein